MPRSDIWCRKAELMSRAHQWEKQWLINQEREVSTAWGRGSGDKFDVSQLTDKINHFLFSRRKTRRREFGIAYSTQEHGGVGVAWRWTKPGKIIYNLVLVQFSSVLVSFKYMR